MSNQPNADPLAQTQLAARRAAALGNPPKPPPLPHPDDEGWRPGEPKAIARAER